MDKIIGKFQLSIVDEQTIKMPKGAEILTVQAQRGIPCLWAIISLDMPTEDRIFQIYGTGEPFPMESIASNFKYIGTIQLNDGALIFHIFEVLS